VLYIVHFTAFCLGGPFFSGHGVQGLARTLLWQSPCKYFRTIKKWQ